MPKLFFSSLFLVICLMNISSSFAAKKMISHIDPACVNHAEDEVIETKTFAGTLTSFVWGDFLHGEFVDNKGKQLSLFIETRDVSCFLALHKARA